MTEHTAAHMLSHISFIGPIGGPELIIILLVAVIAILPAVLIITYSLNKKATPKPPALPSSTERRLAELEDLRTKRLISEEEYEQQRKIMISKL
jgi:flagellar basal body-associated protein FliL